MARRRRINPTRQPIRNIKRIAQRRPVRALQLTTLWKRARLIDPRRLVVSQDIRHANVIEDAHQPVPRDRPARPVLDHAIDLGGRTGRPHDAIFVARVDAHAALRFVHHDRQDEAVVDLRRFHDRLDRVIDLVDLLGAFVGDAEGGAGARHGGFVGVEPCIAMGCQGQVSGWRVWRDFARCGWSCVCVQRSRASLHVLERDPEVLAWPAIRQGAVAAGEEVRVVPAAGAVRAAQSAPAQATAAEQAVAAAESAAKKAAEVIRLPQWWTVSKLPMSCTFFLRQAVI